QPVSQHHQVELPRRGGSLSGAVSNLCRHRDDAVQSRDRVDGPADGRLPVHQPDRCRVDELVQPAHRIGRPMSNATTMPGSVEPNRLRNLRLRPIGWMRRNLFSSPFNSALTILVLVLAGIVLPPLVRWAITHATISGLTREACRGDGACWTFIRVRFPLFIYGSYPPDQYWRVDAAFLLVGAFCVPVLRDGTRHRWLFVLLLLTVAPVLAATLLCGGVVGLTYVDTSLWGGLMLDVIVAFVTVSGSLPLGILLAFGRRSQLRVIQALSIGYIEIWRGVPLLTVLFISAV